MNKFYLLQLPFLNKKNKAKRNKFATYNYSLIAITSIPVFLVGLFNWVIDPQDIFKTPYYSNLNHQKIKKDNNDRLFKAIDIIRLQPDTIIVGSSRTKQGIDPEAAALASSPDVYNLALNGPNFYEVRRYIEHAIYNQPNLEEIILGIDFFMFNEDLANQPTFNEARLEKKHIILDDAIKNLFSIDTFNNSLDTIKASRKSNAIGDNYGDDGFMPNRNSDNGEAIWRFHQSIKLYFTLHSDYQFSQAYWNDFKEIVQLCRENNIKLTVFISPSHATQWESIYATERWDVFEQWKRDLVKIVPVWDFSGYNSITTEEIAKYMKNYVDNSHYTPEIGDLILQRILNKPDKNVPADFGVLLTSENIEEHLKQIESDRQKWLEENPEEAEMVKDFYLEVNQSKNE